MNDGEGYAGPGEGPGGEQRVLERTRKTGGDTSDREQRVLDRTRKAGGPDTSDREQQVLDRIERVRRRRARVREELITLAHGAGGKATQTLIEAVFLESFRNPMLEPLEDGAVTDGLAFTTDSFVVTPLFFPGGDIGDLAVNGTVNDLAMCGARPRYLSAGFILEEGFPLADLRRITASMAQAARVADVWIVTGDTKVVQRGKADGCYVTTSGIGTLERPIRLSVAAARPGDVVIVSGPIGEHGITVMLARGELDIEADLCSDTAPLNALTGLLLDACEDGAVRCLRDATRGGVATIVNEIAGASQVAVVLDEDAVPVRPVVRGRANCWGSTHSTSPARAGWSRWWPNRPPRRHWPPSAPIHSAPTRRSSDGSTTTRRGWSC